MIESWKSYKFSDFLVRSKIPVTIEDKKIYKRITIKTKHGGVLQRDTELGIKIGTKKQFILKQGQFVLSKIDARYGAFGIAPSEVDSAIITGNFWAYDVNQNIISIDWLNNFTNSAYFYDICERASSGITHRKYLNEDAFLSNELSVPDKHIQTMILETLNTQQIIGRKLETQLTHQQTLLKKLRQQILQDAIEGKLTADWRQHNPNVEPASELLERIQAEKAQLIQDKKIKKQKPLPPISEEEKPFDLPKGWVWCRLGDIGFTQTGTTPPTQDKSNFGEDIPFIKPADIKTSWSIDYENEKLSNKGIKLGRLIEAGSVMMVCIGGSIGKSGICSIDVSCNQQINSITPLGNINSWYIQYLLQSPYFQNIVWSRASGGTTPIVNKTKWETISFPFPPLPEQKAIVAKVEKLLALCDQLESQTTQNQTHAEQLMQAVLKEAFTANTDQDNDEVVQVASNV